MGDPLSFNSFAARQGVAANIVVHAQEFSEAYAVDMITMHGERAEAKSLVHTLVRTYSTPYHGLLYPCLREQPGYDRVKQLTSLTRDLTASNGRWQFPRVGQACTVIR